MKTTTLIVNGPENPKGESVRDALEYVDRVRATYGKKAAGRMVSQISADARKVFLREMVNSAPAYSWSKARDGKLRYGSKGMQHHPSQRHAWSQNIVWKADGQILGSGRRMVRFSLKGAPYRRKAIFTSFPLNLWEEDVTYHSAKGWGPWRASAGKDGKSTSSVRPGLHWMRKFYPRFVGLVPPAIDKALRKLDEEEGKEEMK